ncbi:lipoyl(octanoyl) transferase [Pedobacter chinensis]|uniref:Octanoyltransferase n=1 Tax=Pedobacter chinensis TaxID=2282421 RepID=A0A369PX73_9SPHI|nr:lipoyl(octanoyl) transferase LipB [Pedobacter chinensis]RDC54688.1 lipoyl(octanoyl) transferase [Pedobacter chinensis]
MKVRTKYIDLKLIPHHLALNFQIEQRENIALLKKENLDTSQSNVLVLCEHNPILTFGSSAKESELFIAKDKLKSVGLDISYIRRGGAITFHGPGQIVGYPILDLENFKTDIRWYTETMAKVIIDTLKNYDVEGYYDKEFPGVWINDKLSGKKKKICAVGVHLSRWITNHGFAFNISNDMKYYQYFIPCAINEPDRAVTTLSKELGREINIDEVKNIILQNFEHHFLTELVRQGSIEVVLSII